MPRQSPARAAHASDHPWIRRTREAARPLVFAHRGGAGLAPENTLAAFERSHACGVDGFELDVRLSRDGEVVVIHDADVDRTTDGTGRVSALTADELQRLDAGFRCRSGVASADVEATGGSVRGANGEADGRAADGSAWRGRGVHIPLLRELLARFPDELFIIELKGNDPALARAAFAIVRDAGALDRVCFGAYRRGVLSYMRRLGDHAVPTDATSSGAGRRVCSSASREETRWALYRSWGHVPWPWVSYDAFQVPETSGRTRVVSPQFVRAAHAAGRLVQVWTVNDEADMRRLLDWGVDGLITDRPDLAVRVRDAFVNGRARAADHERG